MVVGVRIARLPIGPVLRARLGEPVLVRALDSSPRSRVWLVEFGGVPAVCKQITGGADAAERYRREVTALRAAAGVVPDLLGVDPDARVLVLEYVAADGPTAAGWHVDYAVALARLHACLPAEEALPPHAGPGSSEVAAFVRFAGRLDVAVPGAAQDDLLALVDRLAAVPRDALLHGDPCPDNAVATAGGMRFIDLEQAAVGSGAVELAYLGMGFPTCWCVAATPPAIVAEAVEAYGATWRGIVGAAPAGDLADACVGWVITGDALVERARRGGGDHLARAVAADWEWGTATARERLAHRLGVAAAAAEGRADLAAVARLCAALRTRLLDRWPALRAVPVVRGDPLAAKRP
jgi:aminoglycoside phosphotransferase